MCGFAGAVSFKPGPGPNLAAALENLRHRGPDDSSIWDDGQCWLAHTRLAIIDLSAAGRQPLCNEDGTIWTAYNGEVYNFKELRQELARDGHHFRSDTDTEVVVHAYEKWGTSCLERLYGMFAFVIWDTKLKRLFLARDRVGKKPLFFSRLPGSFAFASEVQALLSLGGIARDPDLGALDEYLTWGYVPAPRTAFANISKLPPAHWMTVQLGAGEPKYDLERYWSLRYEPKCSPDRPPGQLIRETLSEAVKMRLVSDVPLGAFLSGGIDSSIVVGLMAQLSDRPVKTFTIGFDETDYSEVVHARRVAERFGTEHHETIVRPDALGVLPTLVRHFGEPFADSSAVATFYVSQVARREVTVALNGDGGDESFAGYRRYQANAIAEHLGAVPGASWLMTEAGRLLPAPSDSRALISRARRFGLAAAQPMARRYAKWVSYFTDDDKRELYGPTLRPLLDKPRPEAWMDELFAATNTRSALDASMAADVSSYLPFDLLVKMDITSMANSLEARSPFLDHKVMEAAALLAPRYKAHWGTSKVVLKKEFRDILPAENVRRAKMGFGVPVGRWFRGPWKDLLNDALFSGTSLSRGYFEPSRLHYMVDEHLSARTDFSSQLWALLMLELWQRQMVEG